ncbi:hypothetical protein [Bradyrhizobium sp. SZCCHNR2009]|uniref:hypothetical protein n=1 Tax=Bradyrhizobium sp. SZCCHNR2009 TaxID=3057375 RepID=UPI0028EA15F4|nr:hypothetical protein [Bradyrhizobium sp. SZCCHNR2009]
MSESAVPETWADARNLILGNTPWILLLVAVERAIESHFAQAGVALIFCFLALGIAIHWNAFEGLGKREGRKRLAFVLIIIGASFLAGGIYLLAAQTPPASAHADVSSPAAIDAPTRSAVDQPLEATRTELSRTAGQHDATAPVAAPLRYTAYEKEQRLRTVDEIYGAVATQLRSIYAEGNSLLDGIYQGQIDDGAEGRLTDYRNKLQAAFDNLNGILKKYNYFPDIVQLTRKNTFNDVEATHGVGNLVAEIQQFRQIAPNQLHWFLLRSSTMELSRNQMRRFDQYLSDATKELQQKRTEIEAARAYAGDNK